MEQVYVVAAVAGAIDEVPALSAAIGEPVAGAAVVVSGALLLSEQPAAKVRLARARPRVRKDFMG